jgi:hypothetical protein
VVLAEIRAAAERTILVVLHILAEQQQMTRESAKDDVDYQKSITSYPTIGHEDDEQFAHARSRGKL